MRFEKILGYAVVAVVGAVAGAIGNKYAPEIKEKATKLFENNDDKCADEVAEETDEDIFAE